MSRRQAQAVFLAIALSAGTLAPGATLGLAAHADVVHLPASVAAEPEPADAPPAAAEAAAPAEPSGEKPKGNAFVRALTAPFRALGRLFGGGRRKSSSAAKRREEQPAGAAHRPETARAVEVTATKLPSAPRINFALARTRVTMPLLVAEPAPAAPTVASVAVAPPAQPSDPAAGAQPPVNLVRPDEQTRAAMNPGMWVPVIEGIAKDPLTQGRALLEHGYISEAISELSIAAAGTENLVEANNLLGLAYDRLGDHSSAVQSYERALVVAPKDPVLLANLGYSLYLSNDFGGAVKRLRQAAKLAPELSVVHNNLGIVQARLGKYDEAFRSFARATNEYDAHVRLASILEFERRDKQAIKHYEAALRMQPNTSAVLERLVALYERTGDRTKADTARR